MYWMQAVKSETDQNIHLVLRDHTICLEKVLHAGVPEVLELHLNFGFEKNIPAPHDFSVEIHHKRQITFFDTNFLDLTVLS
jgi:hypothetical protein